jgi:DNA-binding transcriptional LysR family regulator
MAELLDHDMIGQDRRGALGTLLRRQAEALGRSMRIRVTADGWDIVYRLVQEGLGIGIVAESSLRLFAPDPGLVSLPVLDAWARRQHRVCVRRPEALPEAAKLLQRLSGCRRGPLVRLTGL